MKRLRLRKRGRKLRRRGGPSGCKSILQPICVVGRLPIKCGMGPPGVVECHPVFVDIPGLETVADFFEIDRLLLQAPLQPFDEDVVEVTAVERLVRPILRGRFAPTQTIAIDEDHTAQNRLVIHTGFAMGLREKGFLHGHLRIDQPVKVAHVTAPFSEP